MRAFWEQLKRRKVIRVAIGYCALSWLLVQVAATLIPAFDIPVWTLRLLVLLLALGAALSLCLFDVLEQHHRVGAAEPE